MADTKLINKQIAEELQNLVKTAREKIAKNKEERLAKSKQNFLPETDIFVQYFLEIFKIKKR